MERRVSYALLLLGCLNNFWPWPKFKNSHVHSSTISIAEKEPLGRPPTQNGAIKNFEIKYSDTRQKRQQ